MSTIYDYKKTRAVVIERPYEVRLREITLTEPKKDAYIARTYYSSISSGTDMKTYKGLQHPEQCYYPLVPGYETAGEVVAAGEESDGSLKPGDRVTVYMEGPGFYSIGGLLKAGLSRIGGEVTVHGLIRDMQAAAREVRRTASMAGAAMLAALAVVLDRFTWQVGPMLEIGISFLAVGVSGFLYGPWLAGLAGVVIDILGYFLRPNGDFFFGFVLNEFLLGFIYGCWFYRRKVTLARTFCACLTAVLVLNLCLTPLWLHIMYGNAFVLSAARLLKNAVKLPVDTALLYALLRLVETRLVPQLRRR